MKPADGAQFTAFDGPRRLVSGSLAKVALAIKKWSDAGSSSPILIFDDSTGRLDAQTAVARSQAGTAATSQAAVLSPQGIPRGPSRTSLEDVSRLPRTDDAEQYSSIAVRHRQWRLSRPDDRG